MNKLTKIKNYLHKNSIKEWSIAVFAISFIFVVLPKVSTQIDPSSKILDLSILSVILIGFIILALSIISTWSVIQLMFKRTLDKFIDSDKIVDEFDKLPSELKFKLLFGTLWVLIVISVIAFKPVLFSFNH